MSLVSRRLGGPLVLVTVGVAKGTVSWMRSCRAAGPSGMVVEIIGAAGSAGAATIRDLAIAIIRDRKVPSDWEQSFIVCLYKGKGDALD